MFSAEYYEDLRGRATALLIAVESDLPAGQVDVLAELIDHNEPGVAVEMITAILAEVGAEIAADQVGQIESLVRDMGLDDSVARQARALVSNA